ncbi:MAG: hypothetical protein JWO50_26 [Candidatus Kaiserbacteria bacterium]|nr:hypothetical protein [Candidatus Kaiserbacteria bacterium]
MSITNCFTLEKSGAIVQGIKGVEKVCGVYRLTVSHEKKSITVPFQFRDGRLPGISIDRTKLLHAVPSAAYLKEHGRKKFELMPASESPTCRILRIDTDGLCFDFDPIAADDLNLWPGYSGTPEALCTVGKKSRHKVQLVVCNPHAGILVVDSSQRVANIMYSDAAQEFIVRPAWPIEVIRQIYAYVLSQLASTDIERRNKVRMLEWARHTIEALPNKDAKIRDYLSLVNRRYREVISSL